ncbi:MAG TPA: hypothetical protein VGJ05_06590 [Fimbriiglobus sp.]
MLDRHDGRASRLPRPQPTAPQGGPSPRQFVAGARDAAEPIAAGRPNPRTTRSLSHDGHATLAAAEAVGTTFSNVCPQASHE